MEVADGPGHPGDAVPAPGGSPVEEKLVEPRRDGRAQQRKRRRVGNPADQLRQLRPAVAVRSVQDGRQALRRGERDQRHYGHRPVPGSGFVPFKSSCHFYTQFEKNAPTAASRLYVIYRLAGLYFCLLLWF